MMKVDKSIFRWDGCSDQPHVVEKRAKWSIRGANLIEILPDRLAAVSSFLGFLLKTASRNIRIVPKRSRRIKEFLPYRNEDCIGICVNPDHPVEDGKPLSGSDLSKIVGTLNLRRISIRIPLRDIDNLQSYVDFVKSFEGYKILAVILQDRDCIEDEERLRTALRRIFSSLSGLVDHYQIGNGVNRLKWGFVTQREYFEFFRTAWDLRNREFPYVKLLGGAVIDFEILDHCRSLRNGFAFKYDGYASLLYVDRRGAPENRQLGFDLQGKMDLLSRLMVEGNKLDAANTRLWITEVNWPLLDTGRHAPALDDTRVDEQAQLDFLVRYYLLALATGSLAACFWHQLVAPGYGLVDNRHGAVRKRPAFYCFSVLCRLFNGAVIEKFGRQDELGHYRLTARKDGVEILALWCCGRETSIPMPPDKVAMDIKGETLPTTIGQPVVISDSTIYLIDG